MKGSVQWYVAGAGEGRVADVLACCDAGGLAIEHPVTGVVTYLADEPGREGEQVATTARELAAAVERKLEAGGACVVQLWLQGDDDVLCTVRRVARWDSTLFDFDFNGLGPQEADKLAVVLFEARRKAAHATQLWLVEFVGLGVEHGPAHDWDGAHAPAWPAPE